MKNKYKAIEILNESGIICDNPKCDFEDKSVTEKDLKLHINRECPKCGDNLLTQKDYNHHKTFIKIINFINIIFFIPLFLSGGKKEKNCKSTSYHHHDGTTTIKDE